MFALIAHNNTSCAAVYTASWRARSPHIFCMTAILSRAITACWISSCLYLVQRASISFSCQLRMPARCLSHH